MSELDEKPAVEAPARSVSPENCVASLIDAFLEDVATRCSPATVTHYRKRLAAFKRSLGNILLPDLTEQHVVTHLNSESKHASGELKAPDTVRASVIAWQQFQKWLLKHGLPKALTDKLAKPGGRKREILPTRDETRRLLEKASESFKSIYLALRLTGARPNELTRAQICEFDRVAQEIVLQRHKTARKTGESRRLAVGHESLKEIIRTAIGQRTEGPIFERVPGREWTVDQLSAEYRRARDAAGIRKGLVLYCSRHEHGTALYKATGDLKAVADSLGHKSLSTTMRYTRADGDQLKKNQSLFDDTL